MEESLRDRIAERADGLCEYCFSPANVSAADFAVDHILPKSRGGTDDPANLAYCCPECNNRKYTATESRDPVTGLFVPLYHPRRDRWADHFCWSDEGIEIVGLSPTGRATISRLELNRRPVVNLRLRSGMSGIVPRKPSL